MKRLLDYASWMLLVSIFLPPAIAAQANTILHVSRTDPVCGGHSSCFSTIQSAVNAAGPGTTIRIQAGNYREQLAITGKNDFAGASEFDRITIEADPASRPGDVVLTGSQGSCNEKHAIRLQRSRFITIRGLTITGAGGQSILLLGGNNQNQSIHIELNRIFGNGTASCNGGIVVARGNPDTLIVNNLIHSNGRNGITFIDADGGPHYMINNTVFGNQWNGIDVARNHNVTLANNILNNNGTATGTSGGRFGVRRESSTKPQPGGIKLLNNLICGNSQGQITSQVLDPADAGNYTPAGTEGPGVGSLSGCELPESLFGNLLGPDGIAKSADDDFSLKPNSMAIDVGMDPRTLGFNPSYHPIFEADFIIEGIRPADGNADRAAAFDAGAFEYPNGPPVAHAGVPQTVGTRQLVSLTGAQSTDPEGTQLRFQWTVISQPAGSSITVSGADTAHPTFTPLIAGQYIFQLVVDDGQFASAPATVTITVVHVNQAPIAGVAAISTQEDTAVVIKLEGTDVDSGTLTFFVATGPLHGTITSTSAPECVADGLGSSCTAALTYTPAADYQGVDTFSFTVSDGELHSAAADVTIMIQAVNDPPSASSATVSTDEDSAIGITLQASDMDDATLAFAVVSPPVNGNLTAISPPHCVTNGGGSVCTAAVTFTPASDFHGSDHFGFKASDGTSDSSTATLSVLVKPVNDIPVASPEAVITSEDTPIVITLRAHDVDSTNLTFKITTETGIGTLGPISLPTCASVAIGGHCAAEITYTPRPNFAGTDSFSFHANDGENDSNVATVAITTVAINDAAVAVSDFYSTGREATFTVGAPGVLGNDNDPDSQTGGLSALLVSGPSQAAEFTLNQDGSFSFTPFPGFVGTDAFTYKTSDGTSEGNEATVTISVLQADGTPVAANDFYQTDNTSILVVAGSGVLGNDNNVDAPAVVLVAALVSPPTRAASFHLYPDGTLEYVPASGFTGFDSFTYRSNDGGSDSNIAMVTIAVLAPDSLPLALNDNDTVHEDEARAVLPPGVLGNDNFTPLSDTTASLVSGPAYALSFSLNADGSFQYTPQSEFNGVDSFSYRIFDGAKYSNVAMVNIDVARINDPPIAQSQSATTNENTPVIITLRGSDIDSGTLSFAVTNPPSHGSLGSIGTPLCTAQGQGSVCTAEVTYTPAINYFGADNFSFRVSDGPAAGSPESVSIAVVQVNHAPTADAGGPYSGFVGVPVQFAGSGADPDGNSVTFTWSFGDGGSGNGAGPIHTYSTPGAYTVTLTVQDSTGLTAISQTTATISAALVLNPIGNKTANLGETLSFTVSTVNGTGAPVHLYVAPLPLMMNTSFNAATGLFTFRPGTSQVGHYPLTFSAARGPNIASETMTITVPNPPPGGATAVRGRVVNLAQTPLSNVRVTLRSSGHTSFTGPDGVFTISDIPSGTQQLIVNGRETTLGVYAIIAVAVDLIDGVVNDLSSAISLPDVDVDAEVEVSPIFNTLVINPSLPGVELEIIAGSATNPDGTPFTGKLSINPVPDYGRPESRPEELRPGMAVTIQPAGIRFNPPARITFPNADGMAANNDLNLWSLSPDTGKFNIVGKSAVSADGQSIITVEGGVTASAWHFPLAPGTSSNPGQGDNYCGSCRTAVGSEANLEEGSLFVSHTLASYRSLGQSRSLSLTYSSVTAEPRPIISLDSALSARAAVPNTFSTRLKVGGVQQGAEVFTASGSLPEDTDSTSRISVQFDASNLTTGRYPFEATVFSNYLNSSVGGITTGNVIVVNRSNSAVGTGWAITDLQQLHVLPSGGALLVGGDGSALFFSGGPDIFIAPAREFSILAKNPDGTYTRRLKDGTRIHFDPQGFQSAVVDRNGNTTNFVYDGSGRLTSVADPVGLTTTLTYSGPRLQRITDPAGRHTDFQYDGAGNLIRITSPDSTSVTYAYEGNGRLVQFTNERGFHTDYVYDFAGRFAQAIRPEGETRALTSSKLRGLADSGQGQGAPTNPAPLVRTSDASASLTDGRGNSSRFTLDALGQVVSQTDALGHTTTTIRDSNGLPLRITRSDGSVVTMTYDAKGNLLVSTDPIGATTTFSYEPIFNQVKTIRDPKGNVTSINYDAKGNPIEIIDALNQRAEMTYDARGLLLSVTSAVGTPEQTTTTFTYDARGNLFTATNPKGDMTILAYDNAGNVSHSTDAENRVTRFSYDARNRLTAVLDADSKTTQYIYDLKGNLTQVRDAKNQITTFVYSGLDRLVAATNPLGLTETFVYDGNGNLTNATNRNGQTIVFSYDAVNRLIGKTRPAAPTEVGDHTTAYGYDAVGNLLSIVNPAIGVFNQYDAANRLISSTSSTETIVASSIVAINADTTIGANESQYDGRTLQVNARTLTIDGQHTFANLLLLNGAVLTHSRTTASSQGKLDVVVTGILQIDNTSRIDVTGRGFLGGGQPGNPSSTNGMTIGFQGTNQSGTAGTYGGLGGNFSGATNPVYGDFKNPNEIGSGGGGFQGAPAGNGGGLARIVVQSLDLNGTIKADGGVATGFSAGGSGGGIRIDVGSLSGTGSISANGSAGTPGGGGGGGGGRVAIYYQNAASFNLANIAVRGNTGSGAPNGGAGTIYLHGPGRENGELILDNNNLTIPAASATPVLGAANTTISLTHLRIRRAARAKTDSSLSVSGVLEISSSGEFVAGNPIVANSTSLTLNSALTHAATTGTVSFMLQLTSQNLVIDSTSRIDVSGRGFLGGGQPGNPSSSHGMTIGFQPSNPPGSAGSYGGLGGSSASLSNPVYGNFRDPNEVGSGGGGFQGAPAGNGGGLVRIVAQSIILHGSIRTNGGIPGTPAAAGSGGGVRLDVATLSGSGSISANGSPASPSAGGGGGGGGRVAVYYQDAASFNFSNVSAFGGALNGSSFNGGSGTVYLQGPGRESGELIFDNNNLSIPVVARTPVSNAPASTVLLNHLRVRRGARAQHTGVLNLTGSLELSQSSEFVSGTRIISAEAVLSDNSVLTHTATTATATFKLDLSVENLTIDATSRIAVGGLGFLGGGRPGNPSPTNGMTLDFQSVNGSGTAGSYGGMGGAFSSPTNPLYGTASNPNEVGSGGGAFSGSTAANGGGLIRIAVKTLILNGAVRSNGGLAEGLSAGGSGGGIRIDVGTLSGTGAISANGSAATPSGGGGGGGGRVAIYYGDGSAFNLSNITVSGGAGSGAPNGQAGTIHLQQQVALLDSFQPVVESAALDERSSVALSRFAFATVSDQRTTIPSPLDRDGNAPSFEKRDLNLIAEGRPGPALPSAMLAYQWSEPEPRSGFQQTSVPASTLDDLDPIYGYDLNGNRVSMIDPTGLTTYTYDRLNRLTSITNNKSQTTTFAYDALSRRTSMTHANGVVTTYTYDAASQLTQLAHQLGAVSINSFGYSYDKVGNRKSKTSRDGTHDYTYDPLNRLTQAINPLPTNPLETFNYDPIGNRADSNQNGASSFNAANQLLEDSNFTYEYDNNGNQVRKTAKTGGAITTLEYDAENRLVRVTTPDNTASYQYDGLGRRIEKSVAAATTTVTRYVYDNEDILLELDGANQIIARYTHGAGIDEPLIVEKNGQSFHYHADGLGSITELTNSAGAVVQRYAYSSFGKIESQLDANFIQPYTYTAREFDRETGAQFYRNRFYDPSIGRFLSEDPKRFGAGVNFYSYVGGNPNGRVDAYGLDWLTNLSDFSAGAGDYLSGGFMNALNVNERIFGHRAIPISELLRKELVASIGLDDIVENCSVAYGAGEYAGALLGTSIIWATGLNAGSQTVIFSPLGNAGRAAQHGVPIGSTPIGTLLNYVDKNILEIPRSVWYAASGTYVANAVGSVNSVIDTAGKIVTFEMRILNLLNIPVVPK